MAEIEKRYCEFIEIIKEAVENISGGKDKNIRTKKKKIQEPKTQQVVG